MKERKRKLNNSDLGNYEEANPDSSIDIKLFKSERLKERE
jgi:hypothetical protein